MRAFEINSGSGLAGLIEAMMSAKRHHDENCACRRGEKRSAEQWRLDTIEEAKREIEAASLALSVLRDKPTLDNKIIMGLSISALIVNKVAYHQVIATYGLEGEDENDYVIVHDDKREGKSIRTFNVHGAAAVHETIQSLQNELEAEAVAIDAAEKAKQETSAE